MKRSPLTRSAAVAALTATALATAGLIPAIAHTPVWDKGTTHANAENYVALGDSFTSGPGIAPQRADTCARSEKNFPTLIAEDLDVATYTDASCSGAITADLATAQDRSGRSNDAQFDALSADTTLVTFGTIGGNDLGLVGLAGQCALLDCVPPAGTDPLAQKFSDLRTNLTDGVAAAKELAPNAAIVVVGYSTYVTPEACVGEHAIPGVTVAEIEYLQGQIDRLSDLLSDVADEQGVAFADQRTIPGAADHTACADPSEQWVRGFDAAEHADGDLLHPSTAGMKAAADHLLPVVKAAIADRTPTTPPAPTPPTTKPTPTPVPAGPTLAERTAALQQKARSVRATITCAGPKKNRTVTVKVTSRLGGVTRKGGVSKVVVKASGRTVAVDRKAPFTVKVKAAKVKKQLKKKSSKPRAVVTVKHAGLTTTRTITLKRPACVR